MTREQRSRSGPIATLTREEGGSGVRRPEHSSHAVSVWQRLFPGYGHVPFRALLTALAPLLVLAFCTIQYMNLPSWAEFAVLTVALFLAGALGSLLQAARDAESVRSFGQYTLVRKIGEGGMGVVYEASHALLRRPTAVKLLRVDGSFQDAQEEALARFEREVQLTSQLSHPNTVVIYDYGRTQDGVFYYAMEYIDGIDLERLVRVDGPLPPARVIHLSLQICGSLAEAHQRSLIHRDIKPANLLVCERGGIPDTVKVLDFGLIKRLDGPVVSGAYVAVGTPLYMAPEVKLDPTRASKRSDVYSLGAVMHWLATGTTVSEAAIASLANQDRPLPMDLERVIVRCIDINPFERPETMEELARELMQCRDYQGWSVEDARRYWQERGKRLSTVLAQPASPAARTLPVS